MWVAFGLVSLTLYFAHSMLMDLKAADNRVASIEADQAIEGAALYVSNVLANRANMMTIPTAANFRAEAVKIGDAKFWLIGRDTNDLQISARPTRPFWGLVDEASKVNLNYTAASNFLNLPQMTVNTAAAMYDWREHQHHAQHRRRKIGNLFRLARRPIFARTRLTRPSTNCAWSMA